MSSALPMLHITFLLGLLTVSGCRGDNPVGTGSEPSGCDTIVRYAGDKICLPQVDGWTEAFGHPAVGIRRVGLVDSANTTFGVYISNKQMLLADQLQHTVLDDYFKLYSPKAGDRIRISTEQLTEFIAQFNGAARTSTWTEVESFLEGEYTGFDLSTPVLVETYRLNDNVGTSVYLMRSQVEGVDNFILMTISLTLIKEHIVFVTHYLSYDGVESVKSAKAKSDYFNLRFLEQN